MKPRVLIIADPEDKAHLNFEGESDNWNIFWYEIPYARLYEKNVDIYRSIIHNKIDLILYSRNDQVERRINFGPLTRELKTGYSSFSGIDQKERVNQMKTCFEDFIHCNNKDELKLTNNKNRRYHLSSEPSFSLIFDTEQLGGVKYGLPRILNLLQRYDVRGTFFVTNIMNMVYPSYINRIREEGHEIGLHGRWHEYLSLYNGEKQEEMISEMIRGFKAPIKGANFIGRMNNITIEALIKNNVNYFVYPHINYYDRFFYPKCPTEIHEIITDNGSIVAAPISVETYNQPWFSIKSMIDSALGVCKNDNQHITILCHPFRDGNLHHIKTTEKMVHYLIDTLNLNPVLIKDIVQKQPQKISPIDIDGFESFYTGH